MADLLGTVLSPIVELAFDPMKRHICYAFKCKTNVNTLKERVEALKGEQERLQHSVEDERRNGKRIFTNVDEWLGKVGAIVEKEGNELVLASERAEMKCFFGFCPNLKTRYRVSRKAEKKARELAKLWEERQRLNPISYAAPLPCMEALSTEDYKALETRMKLSEDIIKVLTTDGVSMVGVHGIGGVGKTTLAKEILRQVKEQKLFDEVVMAEVSQNVKVEDIQAKICEALGLKFDGAEGINERARRLYGRLECNPSLGDKKEKELDKEKKKKVLIILDDLWEKFDLVKIGIPSKNQLSGCKIFLTSRDLNVLSNEMDCQKNFKVGCLQEKEAWDLFQKMANNSFEEPDLLDTAIKVAKVCAGLPLAIVTVARTLKDKSLPVWNDALLKLKNTGPSRGLTETIYSALELSYKDLESELQSTFLLCSQMGYNATTGDLLKYGIGLGLFSNVSTLEQAQNRVCASVGRLKELCLLLEGGTNKELAMHDVVREVGRWIAARDDNVLVSDENKKREWSDADKLETCTRIWIFGSVDEVLEEMHCPKLVLAHVDGKDGSLTVPDNLFKGLHKLKVLSFTSFTFSSFPSSLDLLKNLKTLCFHQSMELESASIIGKLTKLEVLSFAKSEITHLPVEIGELKELRLLDLSGCWKLKMIPPNILSRLSKLEELYMGNSFDRWTVEGQESQDTASLGELKQLVYLTNLEISIPDARSVSEDIFPKNLCRYIIFIGCYFFYGHKECKTLTNLKLKLNANLQIEKGLMRLVKKTEDLYLDGVAGVKNFMYDLDNDGFPKLKHLHLRGSPEVQYFADMTKVAPSVALPVLESLYLENLISLEKIYQSIVTSHYFFSKLRKINVENCDRLTHLFLFSVAQGLSQLQEIKIDSCASLETVVAEASEVDSNSCDATDVIEFSQLKSLKLCYLPKLTSFCSDANPNATNLLETNVNEDVKISMPLLNHKILLPNLKKMFLHRIDNMETLWHGQLPAIKNSFQNLTDLAVFSCHSLKYVFFCSLIKCLGQLQSLDLRNCEILEEVILVEEESGEEQLRSSKAVLLPKLQSINIDNLPELKRFCKGYRVECPLLNKLSIQGCPQLKTFVSQECEQVRLDVSYDQTAKLRKPLFDEMVVFPSLAKLSLWGLDSIEKIFPPILILLERFQKLVSLEIRSCDCVEEIFGVEASNNAEHISFQLKQLNLVGLAKLRHIWTEDSSRLLTFPNLCEVRIEDCRNLRYVFPRPIAENLPELEELTVPTLRGDEIVATGENGEEAEVHPWMWPKLKKLDIQDPLSLLNFPKNQATKLECGGCSTTEQRNM